MEKDYAGFESNQPAMDVILGAQDEVDFIKKLEAIAQETGNTISLQVNDLAAGSSAKNKKKDEDKSIREKLKYPNFISMSISLTGNYANLVNFIKKLENTPYYVNIISLDCKKEVETSEKKVAVEPTSQVGIFMPGGNPAPAPERIISEQEEVLNSILSVVIYTK